MDDFLGSQVLAGKIPLAKIHLRNLPVLAEPAAKITTNGGNRKTKSSWQKMIQGLFFDRVYVSSNNLTICICVKSAVFILPDAAEPEFFIRDPALVSAQVAMNAVLF